MYKTFTFMGLEWDLRPIIHIAVLTIVLVSSVVLIGVLFYLLYWRLYNHGRYVLLSIPIIIALELLALTLSVQRISLALKSIACLAIVVFGAVVVYGLNITYQVMTALGSSHLIDSAFVDDRSLHLVLSYELDTPPILKLYDCDGLGNHCTSDNIKILVDGFGVDDNGINSSKDIHFSPSDSKGSVNVVEDGKVIYVHTLNWIGH